VSELLPSVSVVVPTHNRGDRLPRLLDALAAEEAVEIVVVANGSRDGTAALLEARAGEEPRLKPLQIPLADKAAAQQAGVEAAIGDVVLLLDDDVVPGRGLVGSHARRHAERANLLVVGYMPVALPQRRRPGEFPTYLYARSYERVCDQYERDPDSILLELWQGNVSLPRADALRVGLSPPDQRPPPHWYHSDRDFGLRCRQAGLEAIFDRELCARHEHRATAASFLRTSRDSGASRWAVHHAHSDTIGALPEDFFERGAPMPGRLLVRWSRSTVGRRLLRRLLDVVVRAAGSLRLYRLEDHAGFLMGKIEQQRGALDAASALAAGGGEPR
jgi:glycosyltransferase involved in cell wall biosynthesis